MMRALALAVSLVLFLLQREAQAFDCPDGYTNYYGEKCYAMHAERQYFNEARQDCIDRGGDLVSVHSHEENLALRNVLPLVDTWYFIGLVCNYDTNAYTWKDGTLFDYDDTEQDTVGCPRTNYNETQFVMQTGFSDWHYDDSYTPFNYICESTQSAGDKECGQDGYSLISANDGQNQQCIKVYSDLATWTDAEARCVHDGGHLPSVHDDEMNSFLRRTAVSHVFRDGIFLGFTADTIYNVKWTDGSRVDYKNFDSGMPSTAMGTCGAMLTAVLTGEWISVFCDQRANLPFICVRPPLVGNFSCPTTNLYVNTGDLLSPGFPYSLPPNSTCEYFLAANDPSSHILVQFLDGQFQDGDSIQLFDGETADQPMATITTAQSGQTYRTTMNSVMRVVTSTSPYPTTASRRYHFKFMTTF